MKTNNIDCKYCFGTGVNHGDCEKCEQIEKLKIALRKIAECNWPGPIPLVASRADHMQEIAKAALNENE